MRIGLVVVLAAVLAGCSAGDEEARTTTARQATTTTGGGGAVSAIAALVEAAQMSRCFDAVREDVSTSGGNTPPAIARDVERLRKLSFERVPRPRYLTRRAVDRRVRRFLEEYPDAELEADGRALVALGAVPRGTELEKLLRQALVGQVAGFYDPRTKELVVQSEAGRDLDGLGRVVLAHELEHALADQALGLPRSVAGGQPQEGLEDAALAASALVEGDATLVMQAYGLEHLSFLDALRSLAPALASERELAELPHFIRASMVFPYGEGLRFVCELYERAGWRAVNRAYRTLPTSSAEILFPDRYGERPVDPPDPPALPGPWRRIDRQAFGAADLLWLFEAPGGDTNRALPNAREHVGAWAGGELHTWKAGPRTAVALVLVDRRARGTLCASLKAWRAAARVRGVVRCNGRHVRVVIAPDGRTAARLLSLQRARRLR